MVLAKRRGFGKVGLRQRDKGGERAFGIKNIALPITNDDIAIELDPFVEQGKIIRRKVSFNHADVWTNRDGRHEFADPWRRAYFDADIMLGATLFGNIHNEWQRSFFWPYICKMKIVANLRLILFVIGNC